MTLAIGLQGVGGLTKTGSGKLTLGGVNSYAGNTNVLNGTLAIGPGVTLAGGAGSLARDAGAQASVTVTGAGAKWDTGSNPIAVGVAGKGRFDYRAGRQRQDQRRHHRRVREHRRDGEYTQHGDGGRIWVRMDANGASLVIGGASAGILTIKVGARYAAVPR